jgi:hypothetical protein
LLAPVPDVEKIAVLAMIRLERLLAAIRFADVRRVLLTLFESDCGALRVVTRGVHHLSSPRADHLRPLR